MTVDLENGGVCLSIFQDLFIPLVTLVRVCVQIGA